MNVLAFDTCLGAVSVAVRRQHAPGRWQVHDAFEACTAGHAERLLPMIETVMGRAELAFGDLARLAVTIGPGTFTGVRVGVAAARALALATGLPVVGATSLAVMAREALARLGAETAERLLVVASDARRGLVYAQLFAPEEGSAAGPPQLLAPAAIAGLVGGRPALVVGSGAGPVAGAITAGGGVAQARLADLEPHARSLAAMAGDLPPASPLRPLYLRAPDVRPQAEKSLPRAAPRALP
jgi:tRNA threonylcarbamoyladenosine biosynthesis protein TsaB